MRLNDGRVLPAFMGQALRGEDLTVFGDGSQTRSFCYVGDLEKVYLTGALAHGNESENIDLIFVGKVNREYCSELISKAEKFILKKIRFVVFHEDEIALKEEKIISENDLLLWKK
jgi:dTDP-glucose 4,6-dehydratase